jgi:pilus assembly protein CpaC
MLVQCRMFRTAIVTFLLLVLSTAVQAQQQIINLEIGYGTVIEVDEGVADVIVVNQEVVDAQAPKPGRIAVFAKAVGETEVYALNFAGDVILNARVRAYHQKDQIVRMLEERYPEEDIRLNSANGSLMLEGQVENPMIAREIQRSVEPFVRDGIVMNKLTSRIPTTVRLEVQLVEIQRNIDNALGINWDGLLNQGEFAVSLFAGGGFQAAANAVGGIAAAYNGSDANLGFAIDWLETRGYATVLSKPNLVALSGESAVFKAGQRIPVPTTISGQGDAGSSNFGITYEFFGLSLNFTPTIITNEELYLVIEVESSQVLDQLFQINGASLPATTSQSFSTTITARVGQSLAIAGLMQNSGSRALEKMPGLSNVPVLGRLFTSSKYKNNQSEVIAIITPYLDGVSEVEKQTAEMVRPLSNMEYLMMSQDGGESSRIAPSTMKRLPEKTGFSY